MLACCEGALCLALLEALPELLEALQVEGYLELLRALGGGLEPSRPRDVALEM